MAVKFIYAGRIERLFANLLDTLILIVPSLLMVELLGDDQQGPLVLALFTMNFIYDVSFTSGKWQATPGKRLLNMYVIHKDGSPMRVSHAAERYLAFVMPSLPIYTSLIPPETAQILVLWLSFLWFMPILATVERTGIHDMMCHTRVITGKADDKKK